MNFQMSAQSTSNPDFTSVTAQNFWPKADQVQEYVLKEATDLFSYLAVAPPNVLRDILVQYRYFTVYYIPDLALLIARFNDGPMRSFLADILYDELGSGKSAFAHPELYDSFLETIGVDTTDLDDQALAKNIALLDEARHRLVDPGRGNAYAIGLRGMGGECVCQVYIAQLYESLIRNPYIQEHMDAIDWRFWNMHVGEHDIEHREQTRALIDSEFVAKGGPALEELGNGYAYSMDQWKEFWINIFDMKNRDEAASDFPRAAARSHVYVDIASPTRCTTAAAMAG